MLTTGRSAFIQLLLDENVDILFGNPGTTELPIMAALSEHPELHYVLGLQEGIVVAMADGFARASGRLAACNVHVAPGLGNAMGSLYNAKWIGSPIIVTAGQQEQGHGLTEPLLYDPLVPIATPLVKWATEVTRLQDLARVVRRAAKIATTPPTGPVFISLPGDILNDRAEISLDARTRVHHRTRPDDETLRRLASRLLDARSPVIIAGHEIATSDGLEDAARFASALGAPVYLQTVNHGAHFLSEHDLYVGALTRSQEAVRELLLNHDLLILLGSDQLTMSVWNETEALPAEMPIVQIGQRDWELAKNHPCEIALQAHVAETLNALNPMLESSTSAEQKQRISDRAARIKSDNWRARCARLMSAIDERPQGTLIEPDQLMLSISRSVSAETIVVDEGLTSTTSLLKLLPFRNRTSYFGLASGGIGFAVAGAIGISLAQPDRPVLAVIGDGSAMYNIQALWTAAHLKLPITYLICNNQSYHILKQRVQAYHGVDRFVAMDFKNPELDFVGLAQSMGVPATRIDRLSELEDCLRATLDPKLGDSPGPRLLDVRVADSFTN